MKHKNIQDESEKSTVKRGDERYKKDLVIATVQTSEQTAIMQKLRNRPNTGF